MKTIILTLFFLVGSNIFSQIIVDNIEYAFYETNGLQTVGYHGSAETIVIPSNVEINSDIYSVKNVGAFSFANHDSIKEVIISEGITSIESEAFSNTSLNKVTIPSTVIDVDTFGFAYNFLTTVISHSTDPAILPGSVFTYNGDYSNIDLYIPAGTTEAYTAAGWVGFKSITEEGTTLGIGSNQKFLKDNIFVSFSNEYLNISVSKELKLENIRVVDISSKDIKTSINKKFSIEKFSKGVYVLQIFTDKGVYIQKFIK